MAFSACAAFDFLLGEMLARVEVSIANVPIPRRMVENWREAVSCLLALAANLVGTFKQACQAQNMSKRGCMSLLER